MLSAIMMARKLSSRVLGRFSSALTAELLPGLSRQPAPHYPRVYNKSDMDNIVALQRQYIALLAGIQSPI